MEIEKDDTGEVICHACGSVYRLDMVDTINLLEKPVHRLGRFELLRVLGSGGFGTVWQARDTALDRTVAVKVPRKGQFPNEEEETRFLKEGRITAQLRHPGIVTVYEVGHVDGQPMIVSEFVQGITLAEWLKNHQPSFRQAVEWAVQVAEVLDYSHRMGVIHRDLKPANIILDTQANAGDKSRSFTQIESESTPNGKRTLFPRIMDFGMAKHETGETTLTLEGHLLGTPLYMSPEQAQASHRVDGRADIYSLGVILYEFLTGELPFRGTTQMVIHQIFHQDACSPRTLNHKIPRDLDTITLRCIEKDPLRRYLTAGELANDLRRWLDGKPIQARPISNLGRLWRWTCRKPVVSGLIAALVGTFVGGFVAVVWQWQRAETHLAEAGRQRELAEVNSRRARVAVNDFFLNLEMELWDSPGIQPLRQELVEKARRYYQEFVRENPHNPALLQDLAEAYHRLGNITREIGSRKEALAAYDQAIKIYQEMLSSGPATIETYGKLAGLYLDIGLLNSRLGMSNEALPAYETAQAYYNRFKRSLSDPDIAMNAAYLHTAIGMMKEETGRLEEALEHYHNARTTYEELLRKSPENPDAQSGLGFVFNGMGLVYGKLGYGKLELENYQNGIRLIQQAMTKKPGQMVWAHRLATVCLNLGCAHMRIGRIGEARRMIEQARKIQEELAQGNTRVDRFQELLARIYFHLGSLNNEESEAAQCFRKASELQEKLLQKNESALIQRDLASSYLEMGLLEAKAGHIGRALSYYQKARDLLETVLKAHPEKSECKAVLERVLKSCDTIRIPARS